MEAWQQGREVAGRFVIQGLIAAGGMAEVYLAEARGPDGLHRVALKRILPHLARESEFVTMFLDEAAVAGVLRHPGIVPVVDAVTEHGELMLALEYVPGWDLAAILRELKKTQGKMPEVVAASIARDVAETLAYVHSAVGPDGQPLHVVHRDVTPSNLLIGADGRARLLDFGVAKAAQRLTRTATRTLKGKFAYMAPEQARGAPVDARTDLYSLGLVLFEMLAGRRANDGYDDIGLLERAREPRHISIRDVRQEIHPGLDALVTQLLQSEPSSRPSAGDHVVAALSPFTESRDGPRAVRDLMLQTMGTIERPVGGASSTLELALAKVAGLRPLGAQEGGPTRKGSTPSVPPTHVVSSTPAAPPSSQPTRHRHSSWWILGGLGAIAAAALVVLALGAMGRAWLGSGRAVSPQASSVAPPVAQVGFFRLTSDPQGATVLVDGARWIEKTPTVVEAHAGTEHTLEVSLDGYTTHRQSAVAIAGRSVPVHVMMVRQPGRLVVTSEPTGARVIVAGEVLGATPVTLDDLDRTSTTVSVELEGYLAFETAAALDSEPTVTIHARLLPRPEVGTLDVFCEPWARVDVDGRTMAESTPVAGLRLSRGAHTIVLTNPVRRLSAERRMVIEPGRRTRLTVTLR